MNNDTINDPNDQASTVTSAKSPDDSGNIVISSVVRISEPQTGKVILEVREC